MKKIILIMLLLFSNLALASKPLWTPSGARLELIKKQPGKNLNWVFLPGGPGYGSEYYRSFVSSLNLPGTLWLLDLPGDGSNRLAGKTIDYNQWPTHLTEAVKSLDNVVLVTHSFSGLLALSTPQLKPYLSGLVLIDAAPHSQGIKNSSAMTHSDTEVKNNTLAMADHFFPKSNLKEGKKILSDLPYNHLAYNWANKNFYPNYKIKWVPNNFPVLIVAGSEDKITPLTSFEKDKRFFNNKNVTLTLISGASHFPWVGHQTELNTVLENFSMEI